MIVFFLFLVLAVSFIIRMPVSLSMLIASISYFLMSGRSLEQVFSVMSGNMFSNYTMLAAPLFIFMANVMNEGEVTDKLFKFGQRPVRPYERRDRSGECCSLSDLLRYDRIGYC